MEISVKAKYIRISPKKVRMYRDDVVKHTPYEAAKLLKLYNTRPAKILYKTIQSALANVKNRGVFDENTIQFKQLTILDGPSLKRFRAGGRGNAKPYKKRSCHIHIILTVDTIKAKKGEVKTEKKKTPIVKTNKKDKINNNTEKKVINKNKK